MINIQNKKDCVGCLACGQICPKQCIEFKKDMEGFSYPIVDLNKCINCHLCEKTCPVLNQSPKSIPISVFSYSNSDESVLIDSSSGGLFYELAIKTIKDGGVVFGALFNDNWKVIHTYTDSISDITKFQKSKYVQSDIGQSFKDAKSFLANGRKVLFTGTPCQIAGLRLFLRCKYQDLLTLVDVVCHGVPSPDVWDSYLSYILKREFPFTNLSDSELTKSVTDISFRDKQVDWLNYGFSIKLTDRNKISHEDEPYPDKFFFEPHNKNIYMRGFIENLFLRPSCYSCPAKCGKSGSDITLGDFWGADKLSPENFNSRGTSLILANTLKGKEVLESLHINLNIESYEDAIRYNKSIIYSSNRSKWVDYFWSNWRTKGISVIPDILAKTKPSFIKKFVHKVYTILKG